MNTYAGQIKNFKSHIGKLISVSVRCGFLSFEYVQTTLHQY